MRITVAMAILGVILLLIASTLDAYRDPSLIEQAKAQYPEQPEDSRIASEQYWNVRDSQLTLKYPLQNYALTLLVSSLAVSIPMSVLHVKRIRDLLRAHSPRKFSALLLIGILAAFLTPLTDIARTFLSSWRDEYPPWADSIGLALMRSPISFSFLLAIVLVYSGAGWLYFAGGQTIASAFHRTTCPPMWWCFLTGAPAALVLLMILLFIAFGEFFYIVPSILWLTFFLFLLSDRQRLPPNMRL